ncbi:MAG: hypothetical protein ACM3SM_13465 [Bacteroidota bacterium]
MKKYFILPLFLLLFISGADKMYAQNETPRWMEQSVRNMRQELTSKYGAQQEERIARGLTQVSGFWRTGDGTQNEFEEFVRTNFASDGQDLDNMFNRFEYLLEQFDGHMLEIGRAFRLQTDLELGPVYPFDETFAGYDPSAHAADDFFNNKIAFTVLLNFPLTTLDEKMKNGAGWTRRQWAETRLAQRFSRRVPAEVNLAISQAGAQADQYISNYNIWMHHLTDNTGSRIFPPKLRLLSHWNLRDEIKASYADEKNGLAKQKMIQQVMERIVTQTIPAVVVNNPGVDWNPYSNEVRPAAVQDADPSEIKSTGATDAPEPDTRYEMLLNTFRASKKADPYSPTAPTHIERSFSVGRELPEARVKQMFENVLSSPLLPKVARLIEKRLGRKLEPFDIWYNGFRARSRYTGEQLDKIVSQKYPDAAAYKKDIPNMLTKLGFSKEMASYLADHIEVDPARGSGHAAGAAMRSENAHLRTRIGASGMDYKGFNIAVHEMGHNVEQVLTLNKMDHTLLQGVPNTAFTEAIAFVFQANDLKLLGLDASDPQAEALKTLNDFWATYEIAGVALVDMSVWHWMYDHPDANASQLKEAVISISKEVWNKYYAPVLNRQDVLLLGIYSHMIDAFLYLPDYPIGHLIAHQIEANIRKSGSIGDEIQRIVKPGSVLPDVWMQNATGSTVSEKAMLDAAEEALRIVQ